MPGSVCRGIRTPDALAAPVDAGDDPIFMERTFIADRASRRCLDEALAHL
ncbi:hypothetical protein [Streptomyces sp. UNOC14_S4]|nr:hypothetical protein [Streptomyces sp. UNOC14_S4]MCC3769162.1 hypothetical protein [Streptomyces sp. UNOC14_S4]